MEIFDSHAHYTDEAFAEDGAALLASFPEKGIVGVIGAGSSIKSSYAEKALAARFPFYHAAVGVHPEAAAEWKPGLIAELRTMAEGAVAIGEIGLDYHYDDGPDREIQKEAFCAQMELAKELDLPVIIHSRDAAADTLELVQKHRPRGVLHCFSGSAEMAREYLALGFYIGFTGVVTFPNAKKARLATAAVPLDRLLIETDCPYMAPVPYRGKRCDSSMLPQTVAALAEIKGVSPEELAAATAENARRLFGIR